VTPYLFICVQRFPSKSRFMHARHQKLDRPGDVFRPFIWIGLAAFAVGYWGFMAIFGG